MASSPSSAGYEIDSIQKDHSSISTTSVEMNELNPSKKTIDDAGTSGLLKNISIPETSPITSDYPSTYPFTSTSSSLPTTTKAITKKEMIDPLNQSAKIENDASASQERLTAPTTIDEEPTTMSKSEGKAPASTTTTTTTITSSSPQTSLPSRPRLDSDAIGPPIDTYSTPVPSNMDAGPTLSITLLLTSGARHPYKIDEKYLTKRAVTVPGVTEHGKKDPLTISVYTLKELILREWREEWETKPSSPSSIRLIFFGRLLDDKSALKECKFKPDTSNVVHMTIRPQDLVDEEDASKAKSMSRGRDDGESTASCRCVIL